MRLFTRVAILLLFLFSEIDATAQDVAPFSSDELKDVEALVGLSESEIRRKFGNPDEVGTNESKEAIVWTYIVRFPSEGGAQFEIGGYRQIAFWNGKVASVSTRWLTEEDRATAIYETSLAYMAEDNRTIARVQGFDRDIFTDSLRVSRRSDNIWMADMLRNEMNSHATLLVGDAGFHMCQEAMELEAKRIEAKFEIDVTQFSDSLRSAGPPNNPLQRIPR